jgi:hypothetical protein
LTIDDPGNGLENVAVIGQGIHIATAGMPSDFIIDSRDSLAFKTAFCSDCSGYVVQFSLTNSQTNEKCRDCDVTLRPDFNNQISDVNYTKTLEGIWKVDIFVQKYSNQLFLHILGSPFQIIVRANEVHPPNCVAAGGGVSGVSLRRQAQVVVTTKDAWNNIRIGEDYIPDNVLISLKGELNRSVFVETFCGFL